MERKKDLVVRGSVVEGTLALLESLMADKDLPAPGGDDFRKMLGIKMVMYHNLGAAILAEAGKKPKLDRDLVRLAMSIMEKSDRCAIAGLNTLDKSVGKD